MDIHQQHPPLSFLGIALGVRTVLPPAGLLFFVPVPVGPLLTLDLISFERVVKAF
jgi:hypothetical protein